MEFVYIADILGKNIQGPDALFQSGHSGNPLPGHSGNPLPGSTLLRIPEGQIQPPNFKQLGFTIDDKNQNSKIPENYQVLPVRRSYTPQICSNTQHNQSLEMLQNSTLPSDNISVELNRKCVLPELRKQLQVLCTPNDPKLSQVSPKPKKTKTTKSIVAGPVPAAAHRFINLIQKMENVNDVALAISPQTANNNVDNTKKRKRDFIEDIFNEDRLNHIHGWVELNSQNGKERKSFHVLYHQPIILDIDAKNGATYDNLSFWLELRSSRKDDKYPSPIHQDALDWIIIECPLNTKGQQGGHDFYVCDRKKLLTFIYSKLPEKGDTTNNPFDCEYKIYREGRKLQLKTRIRYGDLKDSLSLEFIV